MQEQNGTHQDHLLMSPESREDELSLDWSREGATRSNREEGPVMQEPAGGALL